MTKTYIVDEHQRTRRCIGKSVSDDFKLWSEPETLWTPGEGEDRITLARGFQWADFYGLCPFPHGDGYLGYLWLFEIEKELPNGTNQGKIEVFLAASEEGRLCRRLSAQAFIPWDLNFGDHGGMVTTSGSPIIEDDEIKIYYSDSNYQHGAYEKDFTQKLEDPSWVIRCARLPKEHLVGAYSAQGRIELELVSLQGKALRLNADLAVIV